MTEHDNSTWQWSGGEKRIFSLLSKGNTLAELSGRIEDNPSLSFCIYNRQLFYRGILSLLQRISTQKRVDIAIQLSATRSCMKKEGRSAIRGSRVPPYCLGPRLLLPLREGK